MPPLTRQQPAARRPVQPRRDARRNRRAITSAAISAAVLALVALVVGLVGGGASSEAAGPLASPVPSPDLDAGARPPEVVIATAEGAEIHIPVDPARVTAAAFHPVSDPAAVPLEASGPLRIHQLPREGRAGPETAGLDIGAPAGTAVYSPVDGVVLSVSDYVISGRVEGYEVAVQLSAAAPGLVLRVTHLDPPADGERPSVGTPVRAGVTPIGSVRDFSEAAEQELSALTADAGNHVHMELIHIDSDLVP